MSKDWLRGIFGRSRTDQDAVPPSRADAAQVFADAVEKHQRGDLVAARTAYASVLEIQPAHFDALHLAGVVEYQTGHLELAQSLVAKAIEVDATQAPPHSNLGLILQGLGRAAEALASYDRALALAPGYADAHFNRGNALRDLGLQSEALAAYDRAIALNPNLPSAFNNRGLVLLEMKREQAALASFDQALALRPGFAEAHNNRGTALCGLNRAGEALESFERAISLEPGSAKGYNNRGAALGGLGRHLEALESYARALDLAPGHAEAYYNRGNTLAALRRHEEALDSFERALEIRPDHAEALNARGTTLRNLKREPEALESCDRALAIAPAFVEAHDNRGIILAALGRHAEALASHDKALALRPDFAPALVNRATVLRETAQRSAAEAAYRQAVRSDPESLPLRFKLLMSTLPVVALDPEEVAASRRRFLEELEALERWSESHGFEDEQQAVGAAQPFHLAYQEGNNRELLGRYGRLCARLMDRWRTRKGIATPAAVRPPRSRLRIAIVSAHIHRHSVWNAIVKGWVQQFDRRRFEIEVFHLGELQDEETRFAREHCDRFESGDRPLEAWASEIAARAPDVLIYPEVGMDITTPRLASMRLAPVQIAAWGHPETTGFPTIDYYLSGELFETGRSDDCYTERLVPLPNLGCYYEPDDLPDTQIDLAALGIAGDRPVLVCPGTPFKYTPRHDRLYADIARRLGQAQFVFFDYAPVPQLSARLRDRTMSAFSDAGLDGAQFLRFVPWQSRADFHALMRRADVFLDTLGFSGFNTAMQAVECGLPIATCEGQFMRGRFASALLHRMGLPDLVSGSESAYADAAVRLAADRDFNAATRARLLAGKDILFRDRSAVTALESFLESPGSRAGR